MSDINDCLGFRRLDTRNGVLVFDASIYSSTCLKKALYKFAADFSGKIAAPGANSFEVEVAFASDDFDEQAKLIRAFANEVIDQDLREQIGTQTEATRNLILAEAFSKTSLLQKD